MQAAPMLQQLLKSHKTFKLPFLTLLLLLSLNSLDPPVAECDPESWHLGLCCIHQGSKQFSCEQVCKKSLQTLFSCSGFILMANALLNQQLEEFFFNLLSCHLCKNQRKGFSFIYLIQVDSILLSACVESWSNCNVCVANQCFRRSISFS